MRSEQLQFLTVTELDENIDRPFVVVFVLVDANFSSTSNAWSPNASERILSKSTKRAYGQMQRRTSAQCCQQDFREQVANCPENGKE